MNEVIEKLDEIVSKLDTLYKTELDMDQNYLVDIGERDRYGIHNLVPLQDSVYANYPQNLTLILKENGDKNIRDFSKYLSDSISYVSSFYGGRYVPFDGIVTEDVGVSIANRILDSLTKSEMISNNNYERLEDYVSHLREQGYDIRNDKVFQRIVGSYLDNIDYSKTDLSLLEDLNIGYKEKMLDDFHSLSRIIPESYRHSLN